jgi:hypothetical protein
MSEFIFNDEHSSAINKENLNTNITNKEVLSVNVRIMGGGASQNYVAFKLLENYITYENIKYVVEIGSQKGGLSLYLANLACNTEQVLFHTFELNKSAWNDRANEGCGHWLEKIETICPYFKSFELDIFSEISLDIIKQNIKKYKTLIICDGGNKVKEIDLFSKLLKTDDLIMAHDFGIEIHDFQINKEILEEHAPWSNRFMDSQTTFKAFRKK